MNGDFTLSGYNVAWTFWGESRARTYKSEYIGIWNKLKTKI